MRLIARYAIVLWFAFFCSGCLHGAVKTQRAFVPASSATNIPANLQGRGVLRVRQVQLNSDVFSEAKAKAGMPYVIEMNFFDDASFRVQWAQVQRTANPVGYVWTGRVVDDAGSSATMAVSGANVTASVQRSNGRIYQIRTSADGKSWVREIDQKQFPQESQPVTPDRS